MLISRSRYNGLLDRIEYLKREREEKERAIIGLMAQLITSADQSERETLRLKENIARLERALSDENEKRRRAERLARDIEEARKKTVADLKQKTTDFEAEQSARKHYEIMYEGALARLGANSEV